MMFATLTPKERISLCRRAARAAVRRLTLLGQWADPRDVPLRGLFEKLVQDAERHLDDLGRGDEQVYELSDQEAGDLDSIIADFFPSLSQGPGEGFIDRETGSYFAERLEAESADFYRALAEQVSDEESRAFFHHLKEDQESQIRYVRNVLL